MYVACRSKDVLARSYLMVVRGSQAGDQRRDPGQRPPLVLNPAIGGTARIQRGAQPRQLLLIQLAAGPALA